MEEEMKLIKRVWHQIPKNDILPYEDRLKKIEWEQVKFEDYSENDVEQQFYEIIRRTRTYRLLSEILKDAEKELFSKLSLPRKPVPAFLLFMGDNKEAIKGQADKGTFTKTAAKLFNSLPKEQKEEYVKRSQEMKKEYLDVVANFDLESAKKIKLKKRNSLGSPFNVFYGHLKEMGSEYQASAARKKYAALSKQEKLHHILEFLNVREGDKLSLEQYKMAESVLSKEEIAILDEYEGRPKKLSAYNIFMKEYLSSIKDRKNQPWHVLFRAAGDKWKSLPEHKPIYYKECSKKLRDNYDEEYSEFVKSLSHERQEYEINKTKRRNIGRGCKEEEMSDDHERQNKSPSRKRKKKKIDKSESNEKDTEIKEEEETSFIPQNNSPKKKKKREEKNNDRNTSEESSHKNKANKPRNSLTSSYVDVDSSSYFKIHKESKKEQHQSPEMYKDIESAQLNVTNKTEPSQTIVGMKKLVSPKRTRKKREKDISTDNLDNLNTSNTSFFGSTKNSRKKQKRDVKKKHESEINHNSQVTTSTDADEHNNLNKSKKQPESPEEMLRILVPEKPPSSLFKYYIRKIYVGSHEKAKQSFRSLTTELRRAIEKKYNKAKKKYINKFEEYINLLSPKEIEKLEETLQESEDDQISDISTDFSDDN